MISEMFFEMLNREVEKCKIEKLRNVKSRS